MLNQLYANQNKQAEGYLFNVDKRGNVTVVPSYLAGQFELSELSGETRKAALKALAAEKSGVTTWETMSYHDKR